jgi:hypothetical protein
MICLLDAKVTIYHIEKWQIGKNRKLSLDKSSDIRKEDSGKEGARSR